MANMRVATLALTLVIASAAADAAGPQVLAVQPEASVVPANTLRWYVVFDRPARGWVRQSAVTLSHADSTPMTNAFMDFGQ